MAHPFRISVVQTRPSYLDRDRNLDEIARRLSGLKTDLVVLPELCSSGYNFRSRRDVDRIAERVADGPTIQLLALLARGNNYAIVAGFPERAGKRLYNSSVFVTPRAVEVYRKVHVFWKEKRFFSAGNTPFSVHRWKGAKIGMMICFDWVFPEAARTLALRGADILAHPSNLVLPWAPEGMKIRSLENHVYSATANRVGTERDLTFIGSSQLVAPDGRVLTRMSREQVGVRTVRVDLARARDKRATPLNDLFKDRRTSFYER